MRWLNRNIPQPVRDVGEFGLRDRLYRSVRGASIRDDRIMNHGLNLPTSLRELEVSRGNTGRVFHHSNQVITIVNS